MAKDKKKKKKSDKTKEDKRRAKALGKGLARNVADAMIERRKRQQKLLKKIK